MFLCVACPPKQDPDLFYETSGVVLSEKIIDSLGHEILKPLNEFLIKYDESYKDKMGFGN